MKRPRRVTAEYLPHQVLESACFSSRNLRPLVKCPGIKRHHRCLRGRRDEQCVDGRRRCDFGKLMHKRPAICHFGQDLIDGVLGSSRTYVQLADGLHCRTREKKAVFYLEPCGVDKL